MNECDSSAVDTRSGRMRGVTGGAPLLSLLLAVAPAAAAGCGASAPVQPLTGPTWVCSPVGLSITLPEGWVLHEGGLLAQGNPAHLLDAVAPGAVTRGGLNLTVFGVPAPEGESLDQLVLGNLEALRRSNPGLEVRDQKRIQVKGIPVHRVLCRLPGERGGKSQLLYTLREEGHLVALTFSADREFEDEVEAVGKAVVESLTPEG